MAWALVGAAVTTINGTSVGKPAGVAAGHLLVCIQTYADTVSTGSAPTGFTEIPAARVSSTSASTQFRMWWKVADGTEGTSFTFTNSGAVYQDLAMLAYSGLNQTSPLDAATSSIAASATTTTGITFPQVTTTSDGDLWIGATGGPQSPTWTASAPLTTRVAGNWDGGDIVDTTISPAGLTGSFVDKPSVAQTSEVVLTVATFKLVPTVPQQTLNPNADVVVGAWTTDTGATTNLYTAIDETTINDADYIQSPLAPSSAATTVGFAPSNTPIDTTNQVTVSYRAVQSGGEQVDLTVELLQGTTVLQTWTQTNLSATITTYTQTVAAGVITDASQLRLRFTANRPTPATPTASGTLKRPTATVSTTGTWTNPNNSWLSDNVYATVSPAKNQNSQINLGSFGLVIPTGATISSVVLTYEHKFASATTGMSLGISAVINGVSQTGHTDTTLPTTDAAKTVDITADRSWTPADFTDANFRVNVTFFRSNAVSSTVVCSLDAVGVTVTYTAPTSSQARVTQSQIVVPITTPSGNSVTRTLSASIARSNTANRALTSTRTGVSSVARSNIVGKALAGIRTATLSIARSTVTNRTLAGKRTEATSVVRTDTVGRNKTTQRAILSTVARTDILNRTVTLGRMIVSAIMYVLAVVSSAYSSVKTRSIIVSPAKLVKNITTGSLQLQAGIKSGRQTIVYNLTTAPLVLPTSSAAFTKGVQSASYARTIGTTTDTQQLYARTQSTLRNTLSNTIQSLAVGRVAGISRTGTSSIVSNIALSTIHKSSRSYGSSITSIITRNRIVATQRTFSSTVLRTWSTTRTTSNKRTIAATITHNALTNTASTWIRNLVQGVVSTITITRGGSFSKGAFANIVHTANTKIVSSLARVFTGTYNSSNVSINKGTTTNTTRTFNGSNIDITQITARQSFNNRLLTSNVTNNYNISRSLSGTRVIGYSRTSTIITAINKATKRNVAASIQSSGNVLRSGTFKRTYLSNILQSTQIAKSHNINRVFNTAITFFVGIGYAAKPIKTFTNNITSTISTLRKLTTSRSKNASTINTTSNVQRSTPNNQTLISTIPSTIQVRVRSGLTRLKTLSVAWSGTVTGRVSSFRKALVASTTLFSSVSRRADRVVVPDRSISTILSQSGVYTTYGAGRTTTDSIIHTSSAGKLNRIGRGIVNTISFYSFAYGDRSILRSIVDNRIFRALFGWLVKDRPGIVDITIESSYTVGLTDALAFSVDLSDALAYDVDITVSKVSDIEVATSLTGDVEIEVYRG